MPRVLPNPPPGFDDLTVDEKIDYVQSLWEHIAAKPEQVPVPQWHAEIVRERLEAYRDDQTPGRPWTDVRDRVERKLRDQSPDA